MTRIILLALIAYLLAVCIVACVNQARANAVTRRQVRAIEWHAAQARHPSRKGGI
jgi:signal transduction histidine kinase